MPEGLAASLNAAAANFKTFINKRSMNYSVCVRDNSK